MPRRITGPETESVRPRAELAEKLTDELRSDREFGQPLIYEQSFETGKARVTVIWDAWEGLPLQDRTATILRSYEMLEGPKARERIALASGLTVPEAHAAGMLSFQIIPAIRKGDPVSFEDAKRAMLEMGGSTLINLETVQLRFSTREEAERAKIRLIELFPKSDDVWMIYREVFAFDSACAQDEAVVVRR
jgi:hypothetical protein